MIFSSKLFIMAQILPVKMTKFILFVGLSSKSIFFKTQLLFSKLGKFALIFASSLKSFFIKFYLADQNIFTKSKK
jgi:hypothetical protein